MAVGVQQETSLIKTDVHTYIIYILHLNIYILKQSPACRVFKFNTLMAKQYRDIEKFKKKNFHSIAKEI